jgi:hypothetical protein
VAKFPLTEAAAPDALLQQLKQNEAERAQLKAQLEEKTRQQQLEKRLKAEAEAEVRQRQASETAAIDALYLELETDHLATAAADLLAQVRREVAAEKTAAAAAAAEAARVNAAAEAAKVTAAAKIAAIDAVSDAATAELVASITTDGIRAVAAEVAAEMAHDRAVSLAMSAAADEILESVVADLGLGVAVGTQQWLQEEAVIARWRLARGMRTWRRRTREVVAVRRFPPGPPASSLQDMAAKLRRHTDRARARAREERLLACLLVKQKFGVAVADKEFLRIL